MFSLLFVFFLTQLKIIINVSWVNNGINLFAKHGCCLQCCREHDTKKSPSLTPVLGTPEKHPPVCVWGHGKIRDMGWYRKSTRQGWLSEYWCSHGGGHCYCQSLRMPFFQVSVPGHSAIPHAAGNENKTCPLLPLSELETDFVVTPSNVMWCGDLQIILLGHPVLGQDIPSTSLVTFHWGVSQMLHQGGTNPSFLAEEVLAVSALQVRGGAAGMEGFTWCTMFWGAWWRHPVPMSPAGPQQWCEVVCTHRPDSVDGSIDPKPRDSLSLWLPGLSTGENTHSQAQHAQKTSCFRAPGLQPGLKISFMSDNSDLLLSLPDTQGLASTNLTGCGGIILFQLALCSFQRGTWCQGGLHILADTLHLRLRVSLGGGQARGKPVRSLAAVAPCPGRGTLQSISRAPPPK